MFEKITINGIIQGEKCMKRTENLIMQEDRWKPLKEMNLTDDFLFDVNNLLTFFPLEAF